MLCRPWRQIGAVALVLGLAACAALEDSPIAELRSPYDQQPMSLRFASGPDATKKGERPGKVPGKAFDRGQAITDILDNLKAPSAGKLKTRIDKLLATPGLSKKMDGLGGIQARAVLEVAKLTLGPNGNFGGKLDGEAVDVLGKIESFYYKPGEPMHVTVQMITSASGVGGTYKRAEKYRVEIPAGAMHLEQRTGPDDNMFPIFGSTAFPVAKQPDRVFDWKLWAAGEDVRVTDYWWTDGFTNDVPVYPDDQKYTQSTAPANLKSIFEADPDACFDMMFEKNPGDQSQNGALVNGELPPGSAPPYYCLGRCANPPIVNTR
ncbi:MAG: hypothetical protein RQ752_10620 [Thermohalobaculum sp.]|nr:hypothetical protein [Thermohalobaculum sp.]